MYEQFFNPKPDKALRILAVGDVIGRPGRRILAKALPILKRGTEYDAVVVNVENAAGGFGMTREVYREFEDMNIDVMTSGNHIYDKKGCDEWFPFAPRMIRPENFPPGAPGKGKVVIELDSGVRLGVINIMARTFMKPYDCPFRAADKLLEELKDEAQIVLADFHGEATSEKMSMGWYLSGRVSAIWGTHTHVPTADARILDEYTGYQTDLGMTGPYDSVIGMTKEPVIKGFLDLGRHRFEVAKDDPRIGGCIFDIDPETGACISARGLWMDQAQIQSMDRVEI